MLNSATGTLSVHFGSKDSAGSYTAGEGSISVSMVNVSRSALGVGGLNLGNTASAIAALRAVDSAIKAKDVARARFGYSMNRLESTAEVINIQTENLMASESRISDVDVAQEMAILTRNQVLAQAGIAMLGQANSMPQMALRLLGG
jgi:flagellin